jgi:hypothetical protein
MPSLDQLFDQFVRERTDVQNVTPRTCEWYRTAFAAFQRAQANAAATPAPPTVISRAGLQQFVIHLRERGVKPVSCKRTSIPISR